MGEAGLEASRGRFSGLKADMLWLSTGYVTRSLAYLGIAALLARQLGPSGFGELSLFMALAAGIAYLAASWPSLAIPVLAARGAPARAVLRSSLGVSFAGAAVCAVLVAPLAWWLLSGGAETIALLGLYAVALVVLQAVYGVFQARDRMRSIALTQAVERILALAALAAIALLATVDVRDAEIVLAVAAAVVCVGAYRGAATAAPHREGTAATAGWRAVLQAVGPMAIVTVCSYLVAWIDLLILGVLTSNRQVGLYALAYQLYGFVAQLGALSIVAVLPRYARSAAAGAADAAELVQPRELGRATRIWAGGVALACVASAAALPVVFGGDFELSAGPLALLLAGAALAGPHFALVPSFIALGRARTLALVSALAVGINVALDFALIPVIGIWGPAVATVAQSLFATVALGILALGRRSTARLVGWTLPAAAAAGLVAIAPSNPGALAAAGVAGLALAASGWRWRDSLTALRPLAR